jgi:hypothetical protein
MGDLFGPDISDAPIESIEEVGNTIDIWSAQFVNRWVFLKHQRPAALKELRELLDAAKQQSADVDASSEPDAVASGGRDARVRPRADLDRGPVHQPLIGEPAQVSKTALSPSVGEARCSEAESSAPSGEQNDPRSTSGVISLMSDQQQGER